MTENSRGTLILSEKREKSKFQLQVTFARCIIQKTRRWQFSGYRFLPNFGIALRNLDSQTLIQRQLRSRFKSNHRKSLVTNYMREIKLLFADWLKNKCGNKMCFTTICVAFLHGLRHKIFAFDTKLESVECHMSV